MIEQNNLNSYDVILHMAPSTFTELRNSAELFQKLSENPGLIIVKFGADWCGPCKKIAPTVKSCLELFDENTHFYDIDIDNNFEIYGFMRTKKMATAIPTILCWKPGNVNYVPDHVLTSSDIQEVKTFFETIK